MVLGKKKILEKMEEESSIENIEVLKEEIYKEAEKTNIPKDSLRVNMKVLNFLDESKTEVKKKYYILKVLEVIQYNECDQLSIDDIK